MTQPDGERPRPPLPDKLRPFRFASFETHRLPNGLLVYLAAYPRAPLIHLLLVCHGGAQHEPIERAGLATLAASLLDEGSEDYSALEIAHRVESLGGYLSTDADWDSLSVCLEVLSAHFEPALELLTEVASRATLPAAELERLRSQRLADLKRRRARPEALAGDALLNIVYGDAVYGRPILGTDGTVTAIQRGDAVDFVRRHVSPQGAALIVAGDFEPDRVLIQASATLAAWRGAPKARPVTVRPTALDGVTVCIVDRPDAPQSELRLGHVGVPRTHPHFLELQVLNSLFGGKFTSRINLNLREGLGITYGASSSFARRLGPGPFVVGASISTDSVGQAVTQILAELRRLQHEPVSAAELRDTVSYLQGVFPYTLQTIEGLADRLADLEIYGLASDYYDTYFDRLESVTAEDLRQLACRHLDPDNIAVVVVGPARQLEPQLADLGTVSIETLE